jgi:hypothetical protein
MRSVGIPVSLDLTPQWNRFSGNHAWLSTIDKNGKARSFNGGEPDVDFPDGVYVPIGQKGRTTKMYRVTFAQQKNALPLKIQSKDIPAFFQNSNIIDVTDQYDFLQNTIKFDIKIKPPAGIKHTFLCAFGYSYEFMPVAYVKSTGGSVSFPHAGIDAVYFPAYYSNDSFTIASNPVIYYEFKGNSEPLTPNFLKLNSEKFTRKYSDGGGKMPENAKCMIGAKLQASDNKEFKNPITLFTVDTDYYHFVEKDIRAEKPYRYYRYLSSATGKIRIAEVDFIPNEIENVVDKSKKFKVFGYIRDDGKTTVKPIFENAFDGNITTNFNAPPGSWVAIDYGKPVTVSKLRFLVRNDLNIIEIGDEYELSYFDLGWHSLAKQKANHNYIIFNNVPDNALLRLSDLTKGQDERIFIYKDGKQQWW